MPGAAPYGRRALYGGMVELECPARLRDVAEMRPVPDHQECFVDAAADQSLIVEVLELKAGVGGAGQPPAAEFFFRDLAEANEALEHAVLELRELAPGELPHLAACRGSVALGVQRVVKHREDDATGNRVAMLLANIRIPEKDTDILLTVNTPVEVSPESSISELGDAPLRAAGEARALFFHALKTFKINDWGLFG